MATYHISLFGALASPNLRPDLDGYVHTTADEVLALGRWDTGGEDMSVSDAAEIARINVAATEESERAVARWRGGDGEDDES